MYRTKVKKLGTAPSHGAIRGAKIGLGLINVSIGRTPNSDRAFIQNGYPIFLAETKEVGARPAPR